MGYAWIEFGRVGEDGKAQYLTLGCGLSAVAARSQVDSLVLPAHAGASARTFG